MKLYRKLNDNDRHPLLWCVYTIVFDMLNNINNYEMVLENFAKNFQNLENDKVFASFSNFFEEIRFGQRILHCKMPE